MTTLIALAVMAQAPQFAQARVSGIVITEFETPEGVIQIYLPEDMSAGDTISGVVLAEPKGTGEERTKNEAVLRGVVVSIDETMGEVSGGRVVIRGLDKTHRLQRSLKAKTYASGPEYAAPIEVDEERTDKTPTFVVPEVSSAGRPFEIAGPFDGDLGTSRVTVGGKAGTVYAESPRRCIVMPDPSFVGMKSVTVSDAGATGGGTVCLPRLSLSAAKTTLQRGESTTIKISVQGLDDAQGSVYPIPIELTNHTPSVINLAPTTNYAVQRSMVRDGEWSHTIAVSSRTAGAFEVTGVLFNVSLHDKKRLMSPRQFRDWCKALIVVYEQRIKDLEPKRNEAGIENNIQIKRKLVEVLKLGAQVSTEGEKQIAMTAVDKELSVQSFFSVASDLISMAADFLGYTSIPMPNLGTVLKGLAVLAKGSQTATNAVNAAQTAYDALQRVQDAQEKANKIKELQDALNKARDAMSQG